MAARMIKGSILPALAALAALFIVLPTGGGDAEVTMVSVADGGWAFQPAEIEVDEGARIAFSNDSTVTHTATCVGCPWDTGDVQPGETVFLTFDDAARYQFFCRYHGSTGAMTGQLTVGNPPASTPSPAAPPTP